MAELWGSLSVSDHVGRRALVAEALLFDRVVVPMPPEGDLEEEHRWSANKWEPMRLRRMIDILGAGGGSRDLAVIVPWTRAKRDRFRALSKGWQSWWSPRLRSERSQLITGLRYDASQLRPDAMMATRMFLTREYDSREEEYMQQLPRVRVEKVVPAYASYEAANKELALHIVEHEPSQAAAQVIGWELLVPEESDWSDEHALEVAATLSRSDDYRLERDAFRDWWHSQIGTGVPATVALEKLVDRANRLNEIARKSGKRTRILRSFAALGGTAAIGGFWFPPATLAGGVIALVSVGADWILKDDPTPAVLAPAAMFTDARKRFGWR